MNQPHKIAAKKGIDYRPDIDGLLAAPISLRCRFLQDPEGRAPAYIDDQHLTRAAAVSMAATFDPIFANRVVSDHPVARAP